MAALRHWPSCMITCTGQPDFARSVAFPALKALKPKLAAPGTLSTANKFRNRVKIVEMMLKWTSTARFPWTPIWTSAGERYTIYPRHHLYGSIFEACMSHQACAFFSAIAGGRWTVNLSRQQNDVRMATGSAQRHRRTLAELLLIARAAGTATPRGTGLHPLEIEAARHINSGVASSMNLWAGANLSYCGARRIAPLSLILAMPMPNWLHQFATVEKAHEICKPMTESRCSSWPCRQKQTRRYTWAHPGKIAAAMFHVGHTRGRRLRRHATPSGRRLQTGHCPVENIIWAHLLWTPRLPGWDAQALDTSSLCFWGHGPTACWSQQ